jgi:hypothetical protein
MVDTSERSTLKSKADRSNIIETRYSGISTPVFALNLLEATIGVGNG